MDRQELLRMWEARLNETSADLKWYANRDAAWAANFQALHAVSILKEMLMDAEADAGKPSAAPSKESANFVP